jgi:hypothetical protein
MSFNSTDITNGVSISGSTSPFNTYIKTTNAGVYNIQFSAQVDKTDSGADEIVIWLRKNGIDLTDTATTLTLSGNNDKQVAAWNWFVSSAAGDYYQIIWISADTNIRLLAESISGTHPGIPSVILTANRVDQFLSNTGSFSGSFNGVFTGSLFGTASWATNALTASFLNTLNQNLTFNGNLTLNGTASISTLVVNQTQYSSGSNQLGDAANDTQTLFGTVVIPTGSLTVSGSIIASGSDATINGVRVGRGGGNQLSNTAVGDTALSNNTTGTANTAVGYLALGSSNTTGTSNSAFGYLALRFSAGGSNSAFGTTALYGMTAGSSNSAFGRDAGYYIADGTTALTSSNSSVFLGANTKALAQGSANEIVIGQNAIGLGSNSAVLGNDSITRTALKGSVSIGTTGSISSTLHVKGAGATSGTTALRVENTNASASLVVLDNGSVYSNGLGYISTNTAFGSSTFGGNISSSAIENTAFGASTLSAIRTGTRNTAVGYNVLPLNTTGLRNTAVGAYVLSNNSVGSDNTAVGMQAMWVNTSGSSNTAIGEYALYNNTTGNNNTGVGISSLFYLNTGSNNTVIGTLSGRTLVDGSTSLSSSNNSIFVGYDAKANNNGETNQIVIGYAANGIGSNSVVLGNDSITKTALKGNVGIGTTTPTALLHISGSSNSGLLEIDSPTVNNILYVSGSGNIGIATNTSAYRLQINASGSSDSSLPLALTSVDANNRVGILFASSSISSGRQHRLLHRVHIPNVEWLLSTIAGENATWRFQPRDDSNYAMNFLTPYNGGTAYITTGLSQSLFSLGAGSQTAQHINISSSGNVGIGTTTPGQTLTVNGNAQFGLNSTSAGARLHTRGAGNTNASTSFRAENANQSPALRITDDLSARFDGKVSIGSGNFPTASLDIAGTTRISGSFNTAISGAIFTVIGSGSTQPIFTVQGSQGELFSINDSLSGSLFSVNDISGLPILEVFSDSTTLIGDYQDPMLITTKKVTMTNSGSFVVYSLPTASYDTAFFDYSIKSGSNGRAGQIMAIQSGSSVNFTETTTTDFGNTTAVSFTVIVSGSNMVLTGSAATGSWTIKSIIRGL